MKNVNVEEHLFQNGHKIFNLLENVTIKVTN